MTDTLAGVHEHEEVVKKSRFIARAGPAAGVSEAMEFIQAVSEPEATHNCWAYRLGGEYRFSDDGEPGGTAGRPILAAIDGQGLDKVVVVVTRYFGGVKLGAGGLVRAYGGTAASCLRLAVKVPIVAMGRWLLAIPFELSGTVHHWLERAGVHKVAEGYGASGVQIEVEMPEDAAAGSLEQLTNATRGRVVAERKA